MGLIHYRRTRDDFEAVRFEPAGFVIDLTRILTALFGGISDLYRAANVKSGCVTLAIMTIGPFSLNMVPLASRFSLILFTKKRD